MKKLAYALFIMLGLLTHKTYSQQNLIYNGDFELYDTCPANFSQPGDYQIEHCLGWKAPTSGTSDYFNSCNITFVGVPANVFGYQNPYNGNGYCGFYANERAFTWFQCLNGEYSSFYREYIQTKLSSPLIAGRLYKLNFYISLADTACGYAVRNIGALFTSDSIGFDCFKPIIANPQIKSPDFVTDNVGWTLVEGVFIAQGGEQYLTIGNFADTINFASDTLCVKPGTFWQDGQGISYYYVDGLTLEESPELSFPNVITPNSDGMNDYWKPDFLPDGYEAIICNRWGEIVSRFTGSNNYWDGRVTISGIECPDGVYYFIVKPIDRNLNHPSFNGFIQLFH